MTRRGGLLVLEGPDGVGKSTLASALQEHLVSRGLPASLVAFPGNEPRSLGRLVYDVHHRPEDFDLDPFDPASLQTLHVAAHIDSIRRVILPALRRGTLVVLDRYWWSTWTYGRLASISVGILEGILRAEQVCWDGVRPDAILLVLRETPLRPEADIEHHQRLCELYSELARQEGETDKIFFIRNDGSRDDAVNQMLNAISHALPDMGATNAP